MSQDTMQGTIRDTIAMRKVSWLRYVKFTSHRARLSLISSNHTYHEQETQSVIEFSFKQFKERLFEDKNDRYRS